jgi:hypothetical protein
LSIFKNLTALDSPRFQLPFVLFVSNPERSIARPETRIQVKQNPEVSLEEQKFHVRLLSKIALCFGVSFYGAFCFFHFLVMWRICRAE